MQEHSEIRTIAASCLFLLFFSNCAFSQSSADSVVSNFLDKVKTKVLNDLKQKGSWEFILSPNTFVSTVYGTSSNRLIGGVVNLHSFSSTVNVDTWHPGYGGELLIRHTFGLNPVDKMKIDHFFCDFGIGYFESRDLWKYGKSYIDSSGQEVNEILGRYTAHAITLPLRFGLNYNVRNVSALFSLGIESFAYLRFLNRRLPEENRSFRTPDNKVNEIVKYGINNNVVIDLGLRFPSVNKIDAISVFFKQNVHRYWGGVSKRFIGLSVKFKII